MITINKVNGEILEKERPLKEIKATIKDCEKIYDFQVEIQNAMENKEFFAVDNVNFIEKMLKSKKSEILLYYDNEILVGISEINIPDDKNEFDEFNIVNYKKNINKEKIAICESTSVKLEYRGNSLQFKFIQRIEELARKKGCKYIIGTVHPDNIYSYNNFKKLGYEILDEVEVYYGRRYIIFKEL